MGGNRWLTGWGRWLGGRPVRGLHGAAVPPCCRLPRSPPLPVQAMLLGVVYARFSAPSRHSVSIRFSTVMSMYQVGH